MSPAGETVAPDGVVLRWTTLGDGPPVLLLHGFPETRASWRGVQGALAQAGYRAIAPDVRGVGSSDARPDVDYGAHALAADVAALARDVGGGAPVPVVGHDWGGIQAWWAAMLHPEMVERLVVLNVAHPLAYSTERRRPSYRLLTAAFEHPRLLDLVSRATADGPARVVLRFDPVRPVARELVDEYRAAWALPGRMATTLAKDRAERRDRSRVAGWTRPVTCPVLTIWGDRDRYWPPSGAHPPAALVPCLRAEHLPNATHWVVHDEPERVTEKVLEFLGGPRP